MEHNWIEDEFSEVDLNDKRLNDRFVNTVMLLAETPDETINKSIDKASDKKGAYRLFSHPRLQADDLIKSHAKKTYKRCQDKDIILSIHDTTYMSFNTKPSIEGMGSIGGEKTNGYMAHYSMAFSETGFPLGIQSLISWSRFYESPWEKESERWDEGILAASKLCPENSQMIHILDREGDQFNLLYDIKNRGDELVVRSKHDRILKNGDHYLSWHLDKKKVQHHVMIDYSSKDKQVQASLKYGEIELFDPDTKSLERRFKSELKKVKLNIIEVKSLEKLEDKKGKSEDLKWILYTTLPVNNKEDALKVVNYYRLRWQIENYFKVFKKGACKVEKCCLRSYEKVLKYAALFSVIAWKLFEVKHLHGLDPEQSFEDSFTKEEILIIRLRIDQYNTPKRRYKLKHNMDGALRVIAMMGGYNNRKSDGPPGMVSLWRGFIKLYYKAETIIELRELGMLKE